MEIGALIIPLRRLELSLTMVEIDSKSARRLQRRTPEHVTVINADMLRYRFPRFPHVVVGNVPFHLTTAVLERLLAAEHWQTAILLVQWEVASRRAGVGGASMLTASWWPWYAFTRHARVPARSFRPVPGVDGGLATRLHRAGLALHTMPSLPHITIAGACSTATHGSGDAVPTLASAVRALTMVSTEGDLITYRRGERDFNGAVVGLFR